MEIAVDLEQWEAAVERARERGFVSQYEGSLPWSYVSWLVNADARHELTYLDDGIRLLLQALGEHIGSFAGHLLARYEREFIDNG